MNRYHSGNMALGDAEQGAPRRRGIIAMFPMMAPPGDARWQDPAHTCS